MTTRFISNEKIAETSSKGNQEKWREDGRWYKLDQFGYEALTEVLVSQLLEYSNIEHETPFRFTRYRMERMNVHGTCRTGCSSEDFLLPGQAIVTLSHLFKRQEKQPLSETLGHLTSNKRRIVYLAEKTSEYTGLVDFPMYLTLLFEIDALFLNDDRHLNNIAVLERDGKYDYCPIFDNGAALLSNTQIFTMDIHPKALMSTVQARPFNTSFARQRNAAQSVYGHCLRMPKVSRADIAIMLEPLLEYYPERDRGLIADRVCAVILQGSRQNKSQL